MFKIIITLFLLLVPSASYAGHLETSLDRCSDIRGEIEAILESENVSKDFFYLALAESGCRTDARSKAGAVGLWQLSRPTARTYGLTVNDELDERLDWRKSTRAAARYIKHLKETFKEFRWVIAAYNAGGTNLRRRTFYRMGDEFSTVKKHYPDAYNLGVTVDGWKNRRR